MNRWPTRPETLVKRFERAVVDLYAMGSNPPPNWREIEARYVKAHAELLARIRAVTDYQRRQG